MSIHHGDQYSLPLKIKQGTSYLSPSDVDDVRIQVGAYLKSYADEEITYDSTNQQWLFPMTEEMTREFSAVSTLVQVGIKTDGMIVYSDAMLVDVGDNIITEGWDDE